MFSQYFAYFFNYKFFFTFRSCCTKNISFDEVVYYLIKKLLCEYNVICKHVRRFLCSSAFCSRYLQFLKDFSSVSFRILQHYNITFVFDIDK